MIPLPPEPTSGTHILTWAKQVQTCLRRLRLSTGPGLRLAEGTHGCVVQLDAPSPPPAKPLHPYCVTDASSGATPRVSITFGTHNGVVPTIGGTPLSTDPSANILTLDAAARMVYVQLAIDAGMIDACSIHSSTSLSLPTDTATVAFQMLAAVTVTMSGGAAKVQVAQNVSGSQAYQLCGISHLFGLV